jgi:hypothetical protein
MFTNLGANRSTLGALALVGGGLGGGDGGLGFGGLLLLAIGDASRGTNGLRGRCHIANCCE